MTWEYSGDPAESDKDAVRFLIHDTNDADQQLSDEEIDWLLTQNSNVYLAAASACETRASHFRSAASSRSVGGLSITYSNRAEDWASQAKLLRDQAGSLDSAVPTMVWTAQSKSEKELREEDEDLNLGEVKLGMHTNTGTGAYAG